MTTFTVKSASKKKDVDGKHGPMQVIALTLEDGTQVEWFTKASTPVPAPGSTLDGDLEDGQYGKKFKKAFGGGGRGGRSPEETARIERQSARRDAIAYAAIVAQVEKRVPSLAEVETWSRHFFDGVGLGGGAVGGSVQTSSSPPAAESSATRGEKATTSRKLNDLGVPDPIKADVVHAIAGDPPTSEGLKAINAAIDNADYAVLFDEQGIERPPFLPDTRDLGSVA